MFRNITEFSFIKAFELKNPQPDVFGDMIRSICLYKIKSKEFPESVYVVFFLDSTGKVVHINFDE